jgi:hypothetical protein
MIIALDYDGTVISENCYPEVGEPLPYVLPILEKLVRHGHQLVLWTCRSGYPLVSAVAWCKEHNVKLTEVNENTHKDPGFYPSRKIYADIYIDDKGIGIPLNGKDVDWKKLYPLLKAKGLFD